MKMLAAAAVAVAATVAAAVGVPSHAAHGISSRALF
jgi:hypothetical protein